MRMGYKFKGWDWTELAEAFQIECPSHISANHRINPKTFKFPEDQYYLDEIRKLLRVAYQSSHSEYENIIKLVDRFLEALDNSEYHLNNLPKFLRSIEDSYTRMQFVSANLEHLWT